MTFASPDYCQYWNNHARHGTSLFPPTTSDVTSSSSKASTWAIKAIGVSQRELIVVGGYDEMACLLTNL